MIIHDVTIRPSGDLHSRREIDSAAVKPAAVAVCRQWIAAGGGQYPRQRSETPLHRLHLRLSSPGPGVAVATLSVGRVIHVPVTTSVLLAADADPSAERQAVTAVQGMIRRIVSRTPGAEPGYDLAGVKERPLIASLILTPHADLAIVADIETCLAVAYFTGGDA